ncbi:MAG: restriction endonuclease [Salinivirgaceae bacterium]|nr:restriction endonuclease [Salinivirgaceae bacterium]
MQLGPTGYPFETFMGQVIKNMGYDVKVGQVLDGHCVTHEVDVIATKNNHQTFVECKFHSDQGKRSGVQVALYVRSRVDDIIRLRMKDPQYKGFTFDGWVATNTKFSADAISFGECSGLSMLSWDYPRGNSLREILDREHIFPITILSSLTQVEKRLLLNMDIVTCQQIIDNPLVLNKLNISVKKTQSIINEAEFLKKTSTKQ